MAAAPLVTVIIPTYNWSAALKCSIASVLNQSFQDFELRVVGDACDDDSAEVVAGFDDPRISWFNLEARHFSQYGGNNHALSEAKGRFIAYLGHDDVWAPDHLKAGLEQFDRTGADVCVSLALVYGPPTSGIYCLTGLFPSDVFTPRHFCVPSSLMHRKSVIDVIGPWRPIEEAGRPTDADLLYRVHEHGLSVTSTKKLTAFKVNAGWHRGAYRKKSTAAQEELLQRMADEPGFCETELVKYVQAMIEGRHQALSTFANPGNAYVEKHYEAARFKGAIATSTEHRVSQLAEPMTFPRQDDYQGFEWHVLRDLGDGRKMRWSGPSHVSTIELDIALDGPCTIRIDVVSAVEPGLLETLKLEIDGQPVSWRRERIDGRPWLVVDHVPALPMPPGPAAPSQVTFRVANTRRPVDLGINEDTRFLGIAVADVVVVPTSVEQIA